MKLDYVIDCREMQRFHIAIGVEHLDESIRDYSERLGASPEVVVSGQYALWRTDTLNLSIRVAPDQIGRVRHLGWEDPQAAAFSVEQDEVGIEWERFSAEQQRDEILALWPDAYSQKTD